MRKSVVSSQWSVAVTLLAHIYPEIPSLTATDYRQRAVACVLTMDIFLCPRTDYGPGTTNSSRRRRRTKNY